MQEPIYIPRGLGLFHRGMARILDGKALAANIKKRLKIEIELWVESGKRAPSLRCIIVGNDAPSQTYVRNKIQAAREIGITAETLEFDSKLSEEELLNTIDTLNKDSQVDGILVQLPLPDSMNERKVCNAVTPEKDVDGFHVLNVGQLSLDMPSMVPATALGVVEILRGYDIETFGRTAVVVGRSKNVSMPLAMILHSDNAHESGLGMDATVTICHRHTPKESLDFYCKNADILISATGIPNLITADMVKPGATVIDIGITRIKNEDGIHVLVGDVDFEAVSQVAGAITPVPGGVGPMTVAMLMYNTLQAAMNIDSRIKKE